MHFLNYVFYGNTVLTWLITLGLIAAAWGALTSLKWFVVNRVGAFAQRTKTSIDDFFVQVMARTRTAFLVILAVVIAPLALAAAHVLVLPDRLQLLLYRVLVISVLIQGTFWGTQVIDFAITRQIRRQERRGASGDLGASLRTTMSAVRLGARIVLYTLILLLILDNLGINVTALVAGLGVGGIAVALAVQNILGDLFSAFSIVMDKPFVLGDFITVGSEAGTVEKIGLKTTRIKSLSGEQIVFSNTDLLQSRVRNFKRMFERRVLFSFLISYDTPPEKLDEIPSMVRSVIEQQALTRFDRAHLQGLGEWAFRFEVVYFVASPDFNVYAGIEHRVNVALIRRLAEAGISFGLPRRAITIEQMPPVTLATPAQGESGSSAAAAAN